MKIRIQQIHFQDNQKKYLCQNFEPFDNSRDSKGAKLFEYGVMRKLYAEGFHKSANHTGVVSWRFEQKTGISGKDFIRFVRSNPGFDVYFINPFLHEEIRHPNVWVQGDRSHPGLLRLADAIFSKLGWKKTASEIEFPRSLIAYSNYWIGNAKFWDTYMELMNKMIEVIESDKTLRKKVFSDTHYLYKTSFFPFLAERMFSTLLAQNPDIRHKKFEYPPSILLLKYERAILGLQIQTEQSPEFQLGWLFLHKPWGIPIWLAKKVIRKITRKIRNTTTESSHRIF